MDNRSVDVTSEGREGFDAVMKIVMGGTPGQKATHFAEHPKLGLVVFWSKEESLSDRWGFDFPTPPKGTPEDVKKDWEEVCRRFWRAFYDARQKEIVKVPVHPLPYQMKLATLCDFMWNWLQEVEYPKEPDHDGSNREGWRLHNDFWGHVGTSRYAIVGLVPTWAMLGK
jgi:hypothetical protein